MGAEQWGVTGEVEVVGDEDGAAHRQIGAEAARRVGEHHGAAPGGDGGAHAVDHLVGVVALVEVHATVEQEHPPPGHLQGRNDRLVALDPGRREAPQLIGGDLRRGPTQRRGRLGPARAQDHGQVVGVDARQAAQVGGGPDRGLVRRRDGIDGKLGHRGLIYSRLTHGQAGSITGKVKS